MKMMFAKRHLLVGIVVCLLMLSYSDASPTTHSPKVCSYWCKTPQNQIYCCDDDPFTPVHSGHCPPELDTYCGEVKAFGPGYEPPKKCKNDGNCRKREKCCKDTCLKMKVCKPALP